MKRTPAALFEPARQVPIYGEFDVVILGGGPAGIAAAAAAAAQGQRAILVERYGFLGGMGTAAGVSNFFGLYANVYGEIIQVVHGLVDELLARIGRLEGLAVPHVIHGKTKVQAYDPAAYKRAADQLLLARGVHILLHALAAGAIMNADRTIRALMVETKSGRQAVLGKIFIDCSGDGDLAAWVGAPFESGSGNGDGLNATMMFRISGVDPIEAGPAWHTIHRHLLEAEARGTNIPGRHAIVRPQRNPTEWRVCVTKPTKPDGRALNGVEALDLNLGELEGREQAFTFLEFLRSHVPGFSNAYIVDIPAQLGIRETRRIIGQYQLSGRDVISCASFEDRIGVSGLPIDNFIAGDVRWVWPDLPSTRGYFDLPYRMLVPSSIANLLVAGRCASATHEGQAAARASGACFVMGQAAGSAASVAISNKCCPAEVSIVHLQSILANDGVTLPVGSSQTVALPNLPDANGSLLAS